MIYCRPLLIKGRFFRTFLNREKIQGKRVQCGADVVSRSFVKALSVVIAHASTMDMYAWKISHISPDTG